MEVIVNNQTPLTVKDQKGNVLFQWIPKEKIENITEIKLKPMSDDEKHKLIKQIRDAQFTTTRLI